jgi:phage tail P2-like protein
MVAWMSNLLPPNATPQEHALDDATARIGAVPTPIRELWNPDTCPADLLPWLAWALSLDSWQPYWPEAVKRQRIRNAVEIARRKGTAKSVRDVVASFGGAMSLKEWWQNDPPSTPHTFEILLTLGGSVPATQEFQDDVIDEVTRTKPVRSHFTFSLGTSASGALGLLGAIRTAVYQRLRLIEAPAFGEMGLLGAIRPVTYQRLQATEA